MRSFTRVGLAATLYVVTGCGGHVLSGSSDGASSEAGGAGGASTAGASGSGSTTPSVTTSSPTGASKPPPSIPSIPPPPGTSAPPPGTSAPPPAGPTSTPVVYIPPVIDPVDGAVPNYVLGGVTNEGQLVAAYWNGGAEVLVLLDPETARETFVTTLGSLYLWYNQLTYDPDTHMAYATGYDRADGHYLYSASLDTKKVDAMPIPADDGGAVQYGLAGTDANGRVVTAYWDGVVEHAGLLDPKTGALTLVGTLGTFQTWQDQLAYDRSRDMLYAGGRDAGGVQHLYALNLRTGMATTYPLDTPEIDGGAADYFFGGVTRYGLIVAAYWDGHAETAVLISPRAGAATSLGTLGQLTTWQGQLAMGGPRWLLYAIGRDQAGATRIYARQVDAPTAL